METFKMVLELVLYIPFILFLIYFSLKFGGSKLQNLQSGNYIKILEKVALSKENYILLIKLGNKGYVMSSTKDKNEILYELSDEELTSIENKKIIPQYKDLSEFLKDVFKKLKLKKED